MITLVIVAGAVNLLGVRRASVEASQGGTTLAVEYARVTRSGLATPWTVEVTHPGGFDGPVTLTTSADYFDRFDLNGWFPEPSATSIRGDLLVLTFDRPAEDTFSVDLDARTSPTFSFGATATTALDTPGLPALSVEYRTVVMP